MNAFKSDPRWYSQLNFEKMGRARGVSLYSELLVCLFVCRVGLRHVCILELERVDLIVEID